MKLDLREHVFMVPLSPPARGRGLKHFLVSTKAIEVGSRPLRGGVD